MLPRRFAALSVIALVLFGLGLLALALPVPYQGPLLMQWGAGAQPAVLGPALYLADALGWLLLALALVMVWALAVAWERRRRWAAEADIDAD